MMNVRFVPAWARLRTTLGLAGLLAVAACAPGAELGELPEASSPGDVVALEYDATGGQLLKVHAQALYSRAADGATWKPVPLPQSVQRGRIAAVATGPGGAAGTTAGSALYIAGPGLGVVRSEDAGKSWVGLNETLPSTDVTAFARHATFPGTLYAVVREHGIYRSEDAGETWKRMDTGPGAPIRQIFHSDMPGSMQSGWLFAATTDGVRRSMDCFCGWRPTGQLVACAVGAVTWDRRKPEHVYAATPDGVFRSDDGGESWELASSERLVKTALTMDASGVLYAVGVGAGEVLRSADQGRTWEPLGA